MRKYRFTISIRVAKGQPQKGLRADEPSTSARAHVHTSEGGERVAAYVCLCHGYFDSRNETGSVISGESSSDELSVDAYLPATALSYARFFLPSTVRARRSRRRLNIN